MGGYKGSVSLIDPDEVARRVILKKGVEVRFAMPLKHGRKHYQLGTITHVYGGDIMVLVNDFPVKGVIVHRYPEELRRVEDKPWPNIKSTA